MSRKDKMIAGFLEYKGYTGTIEFDLVNNILFGHVQNLERDIASYEGENLRALREDFEAAVDDIIDITAGGAKIHPPQTPQHS